MVVEEVIDRSFPWGYFVGEAMGDQRTCGVGGCIFISEDYWYRFKVGLGEGTNNFAKLCAIKLLQ